MTKVVCDRLPWLCSSAVACASADANGNDDAETIPTARTCSTEVAMEATAELSLPGPPPTNAHESRVPAEPGESEEAPL